MNETFQSLFENVCRCFGHTATTNGQPGGGVGESELPSAVTPNTRNNYDNTNNNNNNTDGQHQQPIITQVNSQASSVSGKRRTNKLELNDKQYDELFDKAKQQHDRSTASSLSKIPPRPDGNNNKGNASSSASRSNATDHETAQAVAQAKIAANPNRYRPKRKRSAQTREEIFRNKNRQQQQQQQAGNNGGKAPSSGHPGGCGVGNNNGGKGGSSSKSSYTPQSDFSRLLNPSLALCFATPIRGTEEMDNEQDVRSVDASDTATLNTNGEDTITSTLYFDSKYAHIQETRPPMPLFNQFKLGPAQDEIRTIMATDSHSSVRMVEIMQKNEQQQQQQQQQQRAVGKDESSINVEEQKKQGRSGGGSNKDWGRSSPNRVPVNNNNLRTASTSSMSLRKKDTISTHNHGIDPPDEEMEDAVPDVKAASSSTDSSRFSNTATRHASS
jgi:hypothetical protein